ncbi:MAG: 3-deoxy-manno-octulosonate cytidylyltransferase [Candidatus Kapaibacterium sp.]
MKTVIIIPARYASERLPKKPLAFIAGMTMIERVYRQCERATGIDEIYVATDHEAILQEVERFGGRAVMTSPVCASGTDRVAEAAEQLGLGNSVIINVQGDEPLIDPKVLTALDLEMQSHPEVLVATPVTLLKRAKDLTNPNVVFAVKDRNNNALYFSRHPIPFLRSLGTEAVTEWPKQHLYFKHIGVYAYRAEVLRQFVALGESPLERAERLEQLRLLEAGIPIRCVEVEYESVAVDTAEDIKKVEDILNTRHKK